MISLYRWYFNILRLINNEIIEVLLKSYLISGMQYNEIEFCENSTKIHNIYR